jgi:hypothetical protein
LLLIRNPPNSSNLVAASTPAAELAGAWGTDEAVLAGLA